jgi:hypothetical protein
VTGLRDAQITGTILFLGVSVKVFLEESSFLISRLSKEDLPSLVWMDIIHSFEGCPSTKRQRKGKCSLPLLEVGHPSSPSLANSTVNLFLNICIHSVGFVSQENPY